MKSPQPDTHRPNGEAGEARELSLLVSVPQAAHLLNLSVAYTWRLVHTGRLEVVRIDRRVQVRRSALDAFIAAHCVTSEAHYMGTAEPALE